MAFVNYNYFSDTGFGNANGLGYGSNDGNGVKGYESDISGRYKGIGEGDGYGYGRGAGISHHGGGIL